uniref:Uncharacterized protein n=1 Tax=Alexandrium catenella TaxID=2925 RepID=A0A7S1PVS1_ALECA
MAQAAPGGEMHRGMMAEESKAGGMGTRNRYSRDYRIERGHISDLNGHGANGPTRHDHGTAHHNGYNSTISSSSSASRDHGGDSGGASPAAALAEVEKRIAAMQHDFKQALHKVNGKDNEKFDLIFAILSELQSRQAQLEETVRALKAQCSAPMSSAGSGQAQQGHQQFGGKGDPAQSYSGMGGQMGGGGQAMFAAMPQVLVVPSPTGAMQSMDGYAMQHMMSPTGAMQPMGHPMAMQFMGQPTGHDYGWSGEGCGGGVSEAAIQPVPHVAPDGTAEGAEQPGV